MTERQATDLTIIGAGPAGLYAAYYAGFRGLSVTLVYSLPEPGGQVAALYPEKACLLYTSPSPRDLSTSRMPSSA